MLREVTTVLTDWESYSGIAYPVKLLSAVKTSTACMNGWDLTMFLELASADLGPLGLLVC
jgi:hypothetical protein